MYSLDFSLRLAVVLFSLFISVCPSVLSFLLLFMDHVVWNKRIDWLIDLLVHSSEVHVYRP